MVSGIEISNLEFICYLDIEIWCLETRCLYIVILICELFKTTYQTD